MMPGYGDSAKDPSTPLDLRAQSARLAALIERRGLERPLVVAHDIGGAVALGAHLLRGVDLAALFLWDIVTLDPWGSPFFRLVAEHADVFARLPAALHGALVREYIAGALVREVPLSSREALARPWLDPRGQGAFYRQIAALDPADTRPIVALLGSVRCPTRIGWGAKTPGSRASRPMRCGHACPAARRWSSSRDAGTSRPWRTPTAWSSCCAPGPRTARSGAEPALSARFVSGRPDAGNDVPVPPQDARYGAETPLPHQEVRMSQLSDLLDPAAIRLDVPAGDWREAIRHSGALLTATGVASDAYADAMVRTVEEHGPYIVIAPGFALAHARPAESVARTGMSFVRLERPVAFGNPDNDPVTLVMALAAADATAHQQALASLAGVLADPGRRAGLDTAATAEEVLYVLSADAAAAPTAATTPAVAAPAADLTGTVPSKNLILTVCGNGLGTSLFLKNTAEQVLDRWGWSPYITVEATDTISAKGKAKDADLVLTSGAIADALGDVGIPVEVIADFTSQAEIDAALRGTYAV